MPSLSLSPKQPCLQEREPLAVPDASNGSAPRTRQSFEELMRLLAAKHMEELANAQCTTLQEFLLTRDPSKRCPDSEVVPKSDRTETDIHSENAAAKHMEDGACCDVVTDVARQESYGLPSAKPSIVRGGSSTSIDPDAEPPSPSGRRMSRSTTKTDMMVKEYTSQDVKRSQSVWGKPRACQPSKAPSTQEEERGSLISIIASSKYFERCSGLAIVVNAGYIGVAADEAAKNRDPYNTTTVLVMFSWIFSIWFVLELFVRILHRGCWHFMMVCPDRWWNRFDLCVVPLSVVENVMEVVFASINHENPLQNVGALRLLRILRLVRTVRVFRVIRWLRELRIMIIAIIRSILPLMWSMVLFGTVIYAFAIYITEQQTFYLFDMGEEASSRDVLEELYGSVWRCAYTLYMCVTGGITWGEAARPLAIIDPMNILLMSFYIFFMNICILNVITGIFVQGAIDSAVTDKEELIQDQLNRRDSELQQLRTIFMESDVDGSGTITRAEFVGHCKDPRRRALLRAIGLSVDQAFSFYDLLDTKRTGEVDIQTLVVACMRLKGLATAVDVAILMYETKSMAQRLDKHSATVDAQLRDMAQAQTLMVGAVLKARDPDARSEFMLQL